MATGPPRGRTKNPYSVNSTAESEQEGLELTPPNILEVLEEVSDHYKLGINLKVPPFKLEEIRRNNPNDAYKCKSDAIQYWLDNEYKPSWWKLVQALNKMKEHNNLMRTICEKTGLIPKFKDQLEDENAKLGTTVTFKCPASACGGKIRYIWIHDGKVKQTTPPCEPVLIIEPVTLRDRGSYKCVAKNEFGHEEESQPAKLIIGIKFNRSSLKTLLKEVDIGADWTEVGRKLIKKLDLQESLVKAFFRAMQECPKQLELSWPRLAQALEGVEGCQSAAHKAWKRAVSEETVLEKFEGNDIKEPDWRQIHEKLGHSSIPPSSEHNGSEPLPAALLKNISWKKLAEALEKIDGYHTVAKEAKEAKVNERNLCDVFRESSTVNWHQVVQKLPLELPKYFGHLCLIEILLIWHEQQPSKDPWIIWRKLVALTESMEGGDPKQNKAQLGIGYKLRLHSGVGLKLDVSNLYDVLKGALESVENLSDIVSHLVPPDTIPEWCKGKLQSFTRWLTRSSDSEAKVFEEILRKWPQPHSWEELARAVEKSKKYGVNVAQKVRELSGSGGCPEITSHCAPDLPSKARVESKKTVTFKCEARGAAPLRYVWICDGKVIPEKGSSNLTINSQEGSSILKVEKVEKGGKYSCRVENEFGIDTPDPIPLAVGDPPTCKIVVERMDLSVAERMNIPEADRNNIPVGETLKLQCRATGTPPLKYKWLHNGAIEECLIIKNVSETDQGQYTCCVTNEIGNKSSTITIKVGEPPVIKSTDIQGTRRTNYVRGETVIFFCDATGTPPLKYTWRCKEFRHDSQDGQLTITTSEDTEGMYECYVQNVFGKTNSKPIELKVGDKPEIKSPPKILGKAVPGGQVLLTCEDVGKGPFKYVWMHNNQTLVNQTWSRLVIEKITEADQGEYKCCLTNAFGYAVSDPVILQLEITLEGLMKFFHDTPIADRWYMFGTLLEVAKSILDRVSRGFSANGNANYSLEEVIGSWLEETNNPTKPHSWATVREVVCRMGHATLAQDLGDKPEIETPLRVKGTVALGKEITLRCKATGKPPLSYTWLCDGVVIKEAKDSKYTIPFATESMIESCIGREYKCRVSNETGFAQSNSVILNPGVQAEIRQKETEKHGAKDVKREFDRLILSMKQLLDNLDPSDTDLKTAADEAVSEIQAYLYLLKPRESDEDIEQTKDLPSAFDFLSQYWNYQRYHLLQKVVNRFHSEEMEKFLTQFNTYQATTTLGDLPPVKQLEGSPTNPTHATLVGESPVPYPPFMRIFKINLESTWATCTLKDTENLLVNLLPDTVSRDFVWSSRIYRAEGNPWCLEYVASPLVTEVISKEMIMKSVIMSSMGIRSVEIDGFDVVEPKLIKSSPQLIDAEADAKHRGTKEQMEQLKELEELKVEVTVEQKLQARTIEDLQQRLQDTKVELDKSLSQISKLDTKFACHNRELEKLKRDKELLEARLNKTSEMVKQEITNELTTQHIDPLKESLKVQGDKVTKLPKEMKEARKKALDVQATEFKEQVKKSTEETDKRLKEMSKDQKHHEEARWTKKEAVEEQLKKEMQECKYSIQELQRQVSGIERELHIESKLETKFRVEISELRREFNEKLKHKET